MKIKIDTQTRTIQAPGFTLTESPADSSKPKKIRAGTAEADTIRGFFRRLIGARFGQAEPDPAPEPATKPKVEKIEAEIPIASKASEIARAAMLIGYRAGRRHRKPVLWLLNGHGQKYIEVTLPRHRKSRAKQ